MAASNAVENNAFLREAITAEGIKREQQELQGYEETGEEVLSLFSAGIPALVEFYENIEAPHRAFSQELQQEINKPELSWFEHFSLSTMAEEHRLAMSGAALLPTSALDATLLAAPLARVAGRAIAQGSKSFFKRGSGMLAAEWQTPIQFELKANTFFVRDAREAITDATGTMKNKVGGLFGKTAPEAVAREETKAIAESASNAADVMKIKRGKNGKVKGVTHAQEHHIIHEKCKDHDLWELAGENPQSRSNKMLLPTKKGKELTTTTRSVHQGRHADESRAPLKEKMDKIVESGRAEGWSRDQYKDELRIIIKKERSDLKEGKKSLYKDEVKKVKGEY
jgi:hypothetical protein